MGVGYPGCFNANAPTRPDPEKWGWIEIAWSPIAVVMPCRAYIADDVEGIRFLWRTFLEETGDIVVVGEAANGRDALEGIAETQPDVLILDLSMPGMDGLEVLRALPAAAPDTVAIVASGFSGSRMAEVTAAYGAAGFFEKGGSAEELRSLVLGACAQSHRS